MKTLGEEKVSGLNGTGLSRSYLDVVVLAIALRNRLCKQKAFEIGQHFEGQFGFEITVKVR